MDNNDILIKLRYALNVDDQGMIEIFNKGSMEISLQEVIRMMINIKRTDSGEVRKTKEAAQIKCTNAMLESFLNGLIITKRGVRLDEKGEVVPPTYQLKEGQNPNNVMLKKLKIAYNLTGDGMVEVFEKSGITVTKGEIGSFLRQENHKHYRDCMDKYARHFLKGLALIHR